MAEVEERRTQIGSPKPDSPFRTRLIDLIRGRHPEAQVELRTMQSGAVSPVESESVAAVESVADPGQEHALSPVPQPEHARHEPAWPARSDERPITVHHEVREDRVGDVSRGRPVRTETQGPAESCREARDSETSSLSRASDNDAGSAEEVEAGEGVPEERRPSVRSTARRRLITDTADAVSTARAEPADSTTDEVHLIENPAVTLGRLTQKMSCAPAVQKPAVGEPVAQEAAAREGAAREVVGREAVARETLVREPVIRVRRAASPRVRRSAPFFRDDEDEEEAQGNQRDEHRRSLLERWRAREF